MPKEQPAALLTLNNHQIRITHPDKLYFTQQTKLTKLDLVHYYLAIAPGALTESKTALSSSNVSSMEPTNPPSIKNAPPQTAQPG